MEDNKIRNIKQREKFIEFKSLMKPDGSTRRIRLSSITQYFTISREFKMVVDGELISITFADKEKALNLVTKLDHFFNISKI